MTARATVLTFESKKLLRFCISIMFYDRLGGEIMENWKSFLYESAKDYSLKNSMSNFILAKKYLIEKFEEVLLPLNRIDDNLYNIEDYSIVRVGNIEIVIFTEFELPGRNIDTLRISKKNVETQEEELSVKFLLSKNGGKIQYGDSSPEDVTEESIDLLLKHLFIDSFK